MFSGRKRPSQNSEDKIYMAKKNRCFAPPLTLIVAVLLPLLHLAPPLWQAPVAVAVAVESGGVGGAIDEDSNKRRRCTPEEESEIRGLLKQLPDPNNPDSRWVWLVWFGASFFYTYVSAKINFASENAFSSHGRYSFSLAKLQFC